MLGIDRWSWDFLYSSKKSIAFLFSHLGSFICSPCTTAFLWFQINHAWIRNNSNSIVESLSKRFSNIWKMSCWSFEYFCKLIELPAYTSWATPHSQRACTPDSGNLLQHGQTLSKMILLLHKIHMGWQDFLACSPSKNLDLIRNSKFPKISPYLLANWTPRAFNPILLSAPSLPHGTQI